MAFDTGAPYKSCLESVALVRHYSLSVRETFTAVDGKVQGRVHPRRDHEFPQKE